MVFNMEKRRFKSELRRVKGEERKGKLRRVKSEK